MKTYLGLGALKEETYISFRAAAFGSARFAAAWTDLAQLMQLHEIEFRRVATTRSWQRLRRLRMTKLPVQITGMAAACPTHLVRLGLTDQIQPRSRCDAEPLTLTYRSHRRRPGPEGRPQRLDHRCQHSPG